MLNLHLQASVSPPGTCSIKILMKPSSLMEPKYCTMFLCFRCLCRAISSCRGWEYLHTHIHTHTTLWQSYKPVQIISLKHSTIILDRFGRKRLWQIVAVFPDAINQNHRLSTDAGIQYVPCTGSRRGRTLPCSSSLKTVMEAWGTG